MKRWVSTSMVGIVLAAVVSCSSGEEASAPTSDVDNSDSAFPVSVDTKFGEVTVPSRPQRVVALGWADAETALALDVQPVGASDWLAFGGDGVGPWAEGLYDESPDIIGTQEPSYEAVAALAPDVILDTKSSGDRDRYDRLSSIAPTIAIPEGADNYLTTVEQQVTMISAALGESDKGRRLLADLEDDFGAAADGHPQFAGETITVGAYSGSGYAAYVPENSRMLFMQRLGFEPSPVIDDLPATGFSVPISEEELDLLDADVLLVLPVNTSATDVTSNPLFQRIPAVRDGRALVFDDPDLQKSYATNSILSIDYALGTVVPAVAKLVR